MYRPDRFEESFNTDRGRALWAFLNRQDNVMRMETASYLLRPAVEPLAPHLLREFGERVNEQRTRQMIGHMARQILEARGFALHASGVRIRRRGNIFTCGSRYIREEVGMAA